MSKAVMSVLLPALWSTRFMTLQRARFSSSRHWLLARIRFLVPGAVRFLTSSAAIQTSRKIRIQIHGDIAITMGNVYLQNAVGDEIMVDKTFVFRRCRDGRLRLCVHKSALP